ncbi:hypothetical protein [Hydrocarboniphaga effusa]|uniref:hypothetical protein n=1 Tax=Hydrocarboniphaga effusa TaxID=243629 RepID=UPI00398BDCBB
MLVQQSQQRLWPGGAASLLVSITVLALLVLVIGGLSGLRQQTAGSSVAIAALAEGQPVSLLEADSPRARSLGSKAVPVVLPDQSQAELLVDRDGLPRALVFESSNVLAGARERALQAGAVIADDDSLVMQAITKEGQVLHFVVKPNGDAFVSAPQAR